jgi:tRNA (guanine37-N1)-methyltransferase
MRLTMDFHVMTLFPEMVSQGLSTSILGRAMEKNLISLECINIRDYSADQKHHKVDDYTYGGGAGMLMQAQPVYDCYKSLESRIDPQHTKRVIYVTPQGSVFNQQMAMEFAKSDDLIFLCGHYEGIDERVLEEIVTDYVSIGDYVLTGGELPAMVMIDTISRLVPGVLNNDISAETESFTDGLLEYPQYSRPEEWMGKKVPPILLSGDHKKVDEWRLMMSLERTKERRPELYEAWMAAHPPKPPKRRRKRRKNTTAVDGTADTTLDSIKDNNADNVEVVQKSGNTNFEDVSSNDLGK